MLQKDWRSVYRKAKHTLRYWCARYEARIANTSALKNFGSPVIHKTSFTLLLPAFRTRPKWLLEAIHSVQRQSHPHWELRIGLCELSPGLIAELQSLARRDPRLKLYPIVENLGISGNTNHLTVAIKSDYVAFLDHDDYLEEHALSAMAKAAESTQADVLYSDEDVVSPNLNLPSPPNLKPDFAPESFLSHNFVCHLCCIKSTLFQEVGPLDSKYDGAQDYDFLLRCLEKGAQFHHVKKILYHWRRHRDSTAAGRNGQGKPKAWEAGRLAVAAHSQRTGKGHAADFGLAYGTVKVMHSVADWPAITLIIPSMNREGTLIRCLDSVLTNSTYPRYEIWVSLNGSADIDALRKHYEQENRCAFVWDDSPFNWSRINNVGARASKSPLLLFMNDDIEIQQADWMEKLAEQVLRQDVGASGPTLLYPDGTYQHTGIQVDTDYIGWDFNKDLIAGNAGYMSRAQSIQNVSAVTGACLCTRREAFEAVGGFDESLPLAFNDIDYGLALQAKGLRVVYTPYACLTHHESLTRGLDISGEKRDRLESEIRQMQEKWKHRLERDTFFDARLFKPGKAWKRAASEMLKRD